MEVTVRPLTPDLWPALEELFSAVGPSDCPYSGLSATSASAMR